MTPDFEKDGIRLFNVDCSIFMAECRDKQYELAITDPPFGDECKRQGGSSRHGSHGWKAITSNNFDKWNIKPSSEYFINLFRISENQIIWGANYFPQYLPPSMGWIFWDKGQKICMSDGELAFTSFDKALRAIEFNRCYISEYGGIIHSAQKPVRLCLWLLENYAKPTWHIFDSHGGSCSLAIACLDMGYECDICEIDKDYFDAAVKRIDSHTRQEKMFKPIAKQTSILEV